MNRLLRMGLLALGLLPAACATSGVLRHEQLAYEAAGRYVYARPIEEVWPIAERLFRDAGYHVEESRESFELVTDWKEVLSPSIAAAWVRYRVVGERIESDRAVVHITRSQLVSDPSLSTRQPSRGDADFDINPYRQRTPLYLTLKKKKNEDRAQAGTDAQAQRDLKMEYALLEQVQPDVAAAIRAEAARH